MLIQAEIVPAQVPALAVVTEAAGVKVATVATEAIQATPLPGEVQEDKTPRTPLLVFEVEALEAPLSMIGQGGAVTGVGEAMTMTGEAMTMTVAMVAGIVGTEVTENNYKPTGDI